jgi:hypothetical protein
VRIEDTEEVLHEPLKGNEAPQRLEKRNDLETRLGDAVRGLKEGMGNTLSTGGATEERRGYASDKVGILPKKKRKWSKWKLQLYQWLSILEVGT